MGKQIIALPSKMLGFKPFCLYLATWLLIHGYITDWIWFAVAVMTLFGIVGLKVIRGMRNGGRNEEFLERGCYGGLTMAAVEAIEQAAGEAAKAAALASLEREAAAIREARRLEGENRRLQQSRVKTAMVTGIVCFFGGLAIGAGATAILTGR